MRRFPYVIVSFLEVPSTTKENLHISHFKILEEELGYKQWTESSDTDQDAKSKEWLKDGVQCWVASFSSVNIVKVVSTFFLSLKVLNS